ncbi:bifunctional DNA primase/polymerase [Phlyctochytrium arcticum]|nr:bifunctional DNA primase/polymerase [Phlyctochytrium arcticum]KAI9099224.1 bifunctional DNA primase/polymerase [Phlyctochytrium arcticum]
MVQTELFKTAKKMRIANPAFVPIPASAITKRPLGKWSGNNYQFERDFPKREVWETNCNIGLLVSEEYIVVDVDAKPPAIRGNKKIYSTNHGMLDFQTLIEQNEQLPPTLSVSTPSGGKHYYFSLTGKEGEETLKNWTSCMSLNGRLIAVDVRKKGGYVMCPPSIKGSQRYKWDNPDGFKTPMAPFPNWILGNILDTMKKAPQHFAAQYFTSNPSANDALVSSDISLLKESEYWQDCFRISPQPNMHNMYIITATAPYYCKICQREHVKNTNHPFLVRHHGNLRFVCRPGNGFNRVIDIDYLKMWDDCQMPVKKLVETMDITNRAVSETIHGDLYNSVLATNQPNQWLVFEKDTGIWREEFRNVILRPLMDKYVKMANELHSICYNLIDKDEIWEKRASAAGKLAYSLSMTRPKNDHLSALFELVRDGRKDVLFNKNRHLLHCTNGVYNLDEHVFREAIPEDYSKLSTWLKFLPYDEHPLEKRQIVEGFLSDIMLDRAALQHFLLKAMSSSLDGYTKDQFFYFFLGPGANGKSLLIKLLKKALGDYGATISSAQVTKPNVNAQAASPSLVSLIHKRGAFLTELEDKVLFTEFLKMVAGGDQTSGRGLFKDQVVIDLMAKVFIAVNDLQCSFTDYPKLPNEKKIIDGFEAKLLQCADTFLALLIKTYTTSYKQEGVGRAVQPQIIKDTVKRYEESQNIPLRFVNASVSTATDDKVVLTTANADNAFANFCQSQGITKTPALVRHLYEMMDQMFPPSNPRRQVYRAGKNVRGWVGARLVNDWELAADDDEEYEHVDKKQLRDHWGQKKENMSSTSYAGYTGQLNNNV